MFGFWLAAAADRRHAEALTVLERITAEAPLAHPRDVAWRAAACGHLGRTEEAQRCAVMFLDAVRRAWRGDPAAGPAEYADWLVDTSCLRRPEDEAHLREGLRLAGLPAGVRQSLLSALQGLRIESHTGSR